MNKDIGIIKKHQKNYEVEKYNWSRNLIESSTKDLTWQKNQQTWR